MIAQILVLSFVTFLSALTLAAAFNHFRRGGVMARQDWTPAEVARLRELAAKGMTGRAAADALGRNYCSVSGKASALGIRFNPRTPDPDRDARAIAALAAGASWDEVSAVSGRSHTAIGYKIGSCPLYKAASLAGKAIREAKRIEKARAGAAAYHASRRPAIEAKRREREAAAAARAAERENAKRAKAEAKAAAGVGSVAAGKRRRNGRSAPHQVRPVTDFTLAQRAASFLCRDYAPVFNRGRENKAEDGIWQVGSRRMLEAEMIELARSKGLDRPAKIAPALVIRSSIMESQRRGEMLPPPGYSQFRGEMPRPLTMFEAR